MCEPGPCVRETREPHLPTPAHLGTRWQVERERHFSLLLTALQPPPQVPNSSLMEHKRCGPTLLFPLHGMHCPPQIHGACSLLPSELCSKFALSESSSPSSSFAYPASLCFIDLLPPTRSHLCTACLFTHTLPGSLCYVSSMKPHTFFGFIAMSSVPKTVSGPWQILNKLFCLNK